MNFLQKFEEKYGENYPNELRMVYDFTHDRDEDDDGYYTHYNCIHISVEEKTETGWKRLMLTVDDPDINTSIPASYSFTDYDCKYNNLVDYLENIGDFLNFLNNFSTTLYVFKLIDMYKDKFFNPLLQQEIDRVLKQIADKQGVLNELYDKKYGEEKIPNILSSRTYRAKLEARINSLKASIEKNKKELEGLVPGYPQYKRNSDFIKKLEYELSLLTEATNT